MVSGGAPTFPAAGEMDGHHAVAVHRHDIRASVKQALNHIKVAVLRGVMERCTP